MNLSKTTKSISLVLISSALVFAGWETPGCLSDAHDKDARAGPRRSGYGGGGHGTFWFTHVGNTYRTGGGTAVGGSGAAGGNHGAGGSGHSGSASSRGGFGSSASGVSA